MPQRNAAVAAIPLALALAGTLPLPRFRGGDLVRIRLARTVSAPELRLEDLSPQQRAWLAEHNPFGLPRTFRPASWTLIVRRGYTLAHNNIDLIADWVSFRLSREYVLGAERRPGAGAFQPDPLLRPPRRAELEDYAGWSGVYDRGHQCASADSKGRGDQVVRESFYLSNMTPQASLLNRNRWRLLEERVQRLARARGELWVITGPLFVDEDGDGLVEYFAIGRRQVAVPTHYYRIVVARRADSGGLEALAFLVPNQQIDDPLEKFLSSIDEIERVSGIDFLSGLPDDEEETLENRRAERIWPDA